MTDQQSTSWNFNMDEAPRNPAGEPNGPWLLIFCAYDEGIREARWQPYTKDNPLLGGHDIRIGWVTRDGKFLETSSLFVPTAWMPLPTRPE